MVVEVRITANIGDKGAGMGRDYCVGGYEKSGILIELKKIKKYP
jgi:hypothetical protein